MTGVAGGAAHGHIVAMSKSDETEQMGEALEAIAVELGKHSGPHPQVSTSERQRAKLSRDLRAAALRYARAYYAEARELGLIPEPWLAPGHPRHIWRGNVEGGCLECGANYGAHNVDDNCPRMERRQ